MVSKARLDLPLPLGPVTTVSFPSGRSTSMPFRLFCRAPRISMQFVRDAAVTLSICPIFEPTGNIRCQSSDSQILRHKTRVIPNEVRDLAYAVWGTLDSKHDQSPL